MILSTSPKPLLRRHISVANLGTDEHPKWRLLVDGRVAGTGSQGEMHEAAERVCTTWSPELIEAEYQVILGIQQRRSQSSGFLKEMENSIDLPGTLVPLSIGHLTFYRTFEIYLSLCAVYRAPISSPVESGYRVLGAEMICTWTEWMAGKSKEYGL